jgi:DNA-binding transcriptional LysR family regulator
LKEAARFVLWREAIAPIGYQKSFFRGFTFLIPHSDSNQQMPANVEAIDSRRLQVFLEAARSTSFSTAAQVLGMVPSAVSHAVKALEEEFQCSLFKRHGPKVTLTKAGIRLLPLAEELLQRMTRLREEIVVLKGRSQHLRVMMPEIFCAHKLPAILPDFMECFPSAIFEVIAGDTDDTSALDSLDECEIDLLISYCDYDMNRVVKRSLFTEDIGIYAAPFHALASFPPDTFRNLGADPLLVSDSLLDVMMRQSLQTVGAERARIWKLPSVQTVLELTRSGQGIAVLPTWVVNPAIMEGWLTQLQFSEAKLTRTCSIYHSAKTELGWSAEVFSNLVSMIVPEE